MNAIATSRSDFGAILHGLREREHVTQSDLARRLGLHRNSIGAWERGDYLPNLTRLHEIIEKLNLDEHDVQILFRAHSTYIDLAPPWNLPWQRNRFFTGREALLQQLHTGLHGRQETPAPLTRAYALSGLGGCGKTQIAVEYAYRFREAYRAVLWLQADSQDTIVASYLAIAEALDLPEKQSSDQQHIIKAVQFWLTTHQHWLLICDNVENFELLQQHLPATQYGSLLLTTRAQATGSFAQLIELKEFSPTEAVSFLLRRATLMHGQQSATQADAEEQANATTLAELLGWLPLALDQAGAYIEENKCNFADYLALYQSHWRLLLRERGTHSTGHPASVKTTFALAITQLQQQHPAAVDLLNVCAFLAPENIPLELITEGATHLGPLLQEASAHPLILNALVTDILRTSLLHKDAQTRMLRIHRLVQAVLKEGMDEETRQMWTERVTRALNQAFPDDEMDIEQWERCERLLPHVFTCATLDKQGSTVLFELQALLLKAANYLRERAQYSQAEQLCLQARRLCEQLFGDVHSATLACLVAQTQLAYQQSKYEEANALGLHVLARCEQNPALSHSPTTASCLLVLARVATELNQHAMAEEFYQRALELNEQALDAHHQRTAECLAYLSLLYWHQARYQEAEPLLSQAFAICQHTLGLTHPLTVTCLTFQAQLYLYQGQYEEAETLCQQALTLCEKSVGVFHSEMLRCLIVNSTLYSRQHRYQDALETSQQASRLGMQMLGATHYLTIVADYTLGAHYAYMGRYQEAETLLLDVLSRFEYLLGSSNYLRGCALRELASLYRDQGQYHLAKQYCQRALTIFQQALGPTHFQIATTLRLHTELAQYQQNGA